MPGGHPYHAIGEAAANAASEGNVEPEEVAAIIVSRPSMTELTGPLHPKDLIDMAHSPAYFAAAGVRDRAFGWEHAGQDKIDDPVIHMLIDKVRVGPEPAKDLEQYRQGALVRIETTDDRVVSNIVFVPKGAGCLGIDWADVETKYRELMPNAMLSETQISDSFSAIRDMEHLTGVSPIIDQIKMK